MAEENEDLKKKPESEEKSAEKPVGDLEGLSEEELNKIAGGLCSLPMLCRCRGCGQCAGNGTTFESDVIGNPGDVTLDPTKKR